MLVDACGQLICLHAHEPALSAERADVSCDFVGNASHHLEASDRLGHITPSQVLDSFEPRDKRLDARQRNCYGYVYLFPDVIGDMPPGVVTVTSTTVPLDLAGTFAVMEVSLLTVNDVAGVDPK